MELTLTPAQIQRFREDGVLIVDRLLRVGVGRHDVADLHSIRFK